jgi:hypothetical protein
MKTEDVYLIGHHYAVFRGQEPRRVIGLKMVTHYKNGLIDLPLQPRLCHHVRFEDGQEDYVPVTETQNGNYLIRTLQDLLDK